MTIQEANDIINAYYDNPAPTGEERADFAEAMNFVYDQTGDTDFLVALATVYYQEQMFDFAVKYYELAADRGNLTALSHLGLIWYYGRCGEQDYEKAFSCFNKAMEMGDLTAGYKLADMYLNGYYVKKNEDTYRKIIEDLYLKVRDTDDLNEPLPEIFTRLARIRAEAGYTTEALSLFDDARSFLSQRIAVSPSFGDLNIMKYMIQDIYQLRKFDAGKMDIYDLYHVLRMPRRVQLTYQGTRHEIESALSGGGLTVRFDETKYASIDDFFDLAAIDGQLLTAMVQELTDFKLLF